MSELLGNWQAGDQQTLEALLPVAYEELRPLAHRYLQKQRPDHTLHSSASSAGDQLVTIPSVESFEHLTKAQQY